MGGRGNPVPCLAKLTFAVSWDMMFFMKFRLLLERDEECDRWSATFPELPGCASAGDTEEEALSNAKEALSLWFEPSEEPIPANAKLVEVALS